MVFRLILGGTLSVKCAFSRKEGSICMDSTCENSVCEGYDGSNGDLSKLYMPSNILEDSSCDGEIYY